MPSIDMPARPLAPATAGASHPIGATLTPDGVNVSVFAKRATAVELLLFDRPEDDVPARVIELVGDAHRTGAYWHAFVPGIGAGQAYGFRAHGPWAPAARPALRRRPGPASTPTGAASPSRTATGGHRAAPASRSGRR